MRKTRLVIQPTRCLHAIGFLLIYMSCPIFADWGLVQPESAAAQRAYSLQRESAKMVVKDPPDSRVTEQPDTSAWAYETKLSRRIIPSSERRWMDVRNQRLSPERSELSRDLTRDKATILFRESRGSLQRRVENRKMENIRRLSRQPNDGGYRLHLEERMALPSRRLVRSQERLDSEKASRTATLQRSVTRSENVRERQIVRNERNNSMRRVFEENDRQSRENTARRERDNRRSLRSIEERREENRHYERRTIANVRERSIERNEMRSGDRQSSSVNEQQRFAGRRNDARQARDNRISNLEEARKSVEGREERRVAEQGRERSSATMERNILSQQKNNERREGEHLSRRINTNIRESRFDSTERQNTAARRVHRRTSQENDQQRLRQNFERHDLPRSENIRRESRGSYDVVKNNQGDNLRTQENNNERRISTRRNEQDTIRRSTRSLSHRNIQQSEDLLTRSQGNERERLERRQEARNNNDGRRSQDNNRENRQRQENSLMRNKEARLVKTVRSNSRDVREQRERSMDRREEMRVIRENDYRKERRVEVQVQNHRLAMSLEKESVMRNSRNEIRFSSRKENNNNREMIKAVELSKDVRNEREMFTKKPYTQDSVDQMFEDNSNNWISYKKIAENCLLGAIAYFVTTRNPKIAY